MEIGRIPSIAPGTIATTVTSGKVQEVQTILPEYLTVPAAGRSESAGLTFREIPLQTPSLSEEELPREREVRETRNREVRREIEIDRDTSALVFRAIDISTGDVVSQYPEEARLRLSSYLNEILE